MKTHPLQKNRTRLGQQKEMKTRTPKAAGSKASSLRAGHSYSTPSADVMITEGDITRSPSAWHRTLISRDGLAAEERYPVEHMSLTEAQEGQTYRSTYSSTSTPAQTSTIAQCPNFPEELTQMIASVYIHDQEKGEELADAFWHASDDPPITKQSLSELDIQTIITNIKLRHNVNFDRDVSFRPNFDGEKGRKKRDESKQYWLALEAELEVYARLFQNTSIPQRQEGSRWLGLAQLAERRIPIMFKTIQEVLKSLVPDRDHARVDEHLDVSMLMQEIERGICDLVRLAEWMAQLLKEHCAPMRDVLVDGMVNIIRAGVANQSTAEIVHGLRELLGILEAMKLDVANHQIKNLKTLLIEDTINFEKHHHLEALVNTRPHVKVDAAQVWYLRAAENYATVHPTQPRDSAQVQFEVFIGAVVAQFFNGRGRLEVPNTFYLDQDRLQTLKAEIEDLVYMEVCMDAFKVLLKQFGHDGSFSPSNRHQLYISLLAIMGDSMGYGSQQWVNNSEALSLEILRQASHVARHSITISHDTLSNANQVLCYMFSKSSELQHQHLEPALLQQVLACTKKHTSSSPSDLFNNLVPLTNTVPPPFSHFTHLQHVNTSLSPLPQSPETARWQDICNRISHIILLHWRVWDRIAYLQENGSDQSKPPSSEGCTTSSSQSSQQTSDHESQVITTMRSGEAPESGQESPVVQQTPSQ